MLDLRGLRRDARVAVLPGLGRPVVLIDRLYQHIAGQGMYVALIAGDQEVVEAGQRPHLRLDRGPCLATLTPQMPQESVGISRAGRPQRRVQEPGEREDGRPLGRHVTIGCPSAYRGQRELIDQLLLEVLGILISAQLPREAQRAHRRQSHSFSLHPRRPAVGEHRDPSRIMMSRQSSASRPTVQHRAEFPRDRAWAHGDEPATLATDNITTP
jgi:hypothetical protein